MKRKSKECNYYRTSPITQYQTECCGKLSAVHPSDILGEYCQYCGRKIKFNEYTKFPE